MIDSELDDINERVAKALEINRKYLDAMGHETTKDKCVAQSYIPNYSRSIEAAWEIVEWYKKTRPGFSMMLGYEGFKNQWWFSFPEYPTAYADTAPLAICLVFLKLKEYSVAR